MNQMKNRLQGLTLLDRAFTAMTDDELEALVACASRRPPHRARRVCGAREGGFTESSTRLLAMRATAARGRLNGGLEQITHPAVRPVPGRLHRGARRPAPTTPPKTNCSRRRLV